MSTKIHKSIVSEYQVVELNQTFMCQMKRDFLRLCCNRNQEMTLFNTHQIQNIEKLKKFVEHVPSSIACYAYLVIVSKEELTTM